MLINFGDFVDGNKADPFIQLLSTLDRTNAHNDFVTLRMSGVDTSATQPALLPVGQGKTSPTQTSSGDLSSDEDEVAMRRLQCRRNSISEA